MLFMLHQFLRIVFWICVASAWIHQSFVLRVFVVIVPTQLKLSKTIYDLLIPKNFCIRYIPPTEKNLVEGG